MTLDDALQATGASPYMKRRADPLFLVSDARSGSTFCANLLNGHPEIGLGPESNFVLRLASRFGRKSLTRPEGLSAALDILYDDDKFHDWGVDRAMLSRHLAHIPRPTVADLVRAVGMLYCEREFPGCSIWGLKKGGGYLRRASELVKHFPNARFLHLVRDGRAVFASKKKALHSRTGRPFETNPQKAGRRWAQLMRSFDAFSRRYPQNACTISYESLLRDGGGVLGCVCGFLDVEPVVLADLSQPTADESDYVNERYRHLHPNVGRPVRLDRIDAWQTALTADEIRAFESVAGCELAQKGYELLYGSPSVAVCERIRRLVGR